MPVTGAIKFFQRSRCLYSDGARVTPVLNSSIENILSYNRDHIYKSLGPVHTPVVSASIQFDKVYPINRLILINFNMPRVNIRFIRENGSFLTPQGVSDIDNNEIDTRVTVNGMDLNFDTPDIVTRTVYLEFDEFLASGLRLAFSDSPDGIRTENYTDETPAIFQQVIATKEIGTFQGFPNLSSYSENQNEIVNTTSTGLKHVVKQSQTIDKFKLRFTAYPIENDVSISEKLYNSSESFTVWPCGGGYGSNHFLFDKEGWRLSDIYNVQTVGTKSLRWYKNFYKSGANTGLDLVEVI